MYSRMSDTNICSNCLQHVHKLLVQLLSTDRSKAVVLIWCSFFVWFCDDRMLSCTSLWKGADGRCAGCLSVFPCFAALPLGAGGGLRSLIVALPRAIFIVFFLKTNSPIASTVYFVSAFLNPDGKVVLKEKNANKPQTVFLCYNSLQYPAAIL